MGEFRVEWREEKGLGDREADDSNGDLRVGEGALLTTDARRAS